jgi:hypothetical protein
LCQPEEGEEEEGGIDEASEEEDYGEDGVVFAEVDAAVASDDAGEMEDVPLEGDGGVLGCAGDGVRAGGVADDPEVDDFEGQSDQQRKPELGMDGSHIRTDGKKRVGVSWKRQGTREQGARIETSVLVERLQVFPGLRIETWGTQFLVDEISGRS